MSSSCDQALNKEIRRINRITVAQWLKLQPYTKTVAGSILGLGPFRAEFACSPGACV